MTKRAEKNFRTYCANNNLRLTPPRLSAFKIVQSAKTPITAYDVLEQMGKDIKNPKPPTAYRALDFLKTHGFIHRIESLNAYVPCRTGHKHFGSHYTICDSCEKVEEVHLPDLPEPMQKMLIEQDFCMKYWNIEIHGRCTKCREKDPDCCDGSGCFKPS